MMLASQIVTYTTFFESARVVGRFNTVVETVDIRSFHFQDDVFYNLEGRHASLWSSNDEEVLAR